MEKELRKLRQENKILKEELEYNTEMINALNNFKFKFYEDPFFWMSVALILLNLYLWVR